MREKIRHFNEVQQYQYYQQKKKNKEKAHSKLQVQLKKEFDKLKNNLIEKVNDMIDAGLDLDDVFHDTNDNDDVRFNYE